MKAIVFERIGAPLDVLELRDIPVPEVAAGYVLVQLTAASINPGDFLFIQSLYPEPKKPVFPGQIAGGHGTGVVVRAGDGVDLAPGTHVAFSYQDVWADYVSMPAAWLIPIPATYPIEKAAQVLNLITARDLLDETGVQPGQWLAITAGNATVSTMISQLARQRDIRVLSIVRKPQPDLDLRAMGSTEVLVTSGDPAGVRDRVVAITGGKLGAVIDCVGGPLLGELVRSFTGVGGQVVIYGGYDDGRFALHNFDVLMKGLTIRPYIYRYFFDPPKPEDASWIREIIADAGRPDFVVRSAGSYLIDEFATAVRESLERPERGKRFLRWDR
jgi:NADPH:quinone reductase-like Zn-dependent oxidoreductase